MKIVEKLLKIERNNIETLAVAMGISYLLGIIIGCIRMQGSHEVLFYIPVGTGAAIAIVLIVQVAMTLTTFGRNFNLAVSMGVIRRDFLIGYQLYTIVQLLAISFCFWILYRIEGIAAGIFFPAEPVMENISALFEIKFLLPALLILWCVEFFVEAVTMKFGAKAWWTIWTVWMAMCIGGPNILLRGLKGKLPAGLMKAGSLFAGGGPVLWTVCGVVGFAAILLISWNILKKQQVTA